MPARATSSLVTMVWLRIAPLLVAAACSSDEGPTGPLSGGMVLYAANAGAVPAILVYAAGANGDVAPIRAIAGANTALKNAVGIARDADGNLYVTNSPDGNQDGGTVTVYAPDASGNALPVRTIAGESTGLYHPEGIALDTAGNVYVASTYGVTVYPPGASGNAAPIRTIGTSLRIQGIALDTAGNLYVSSGSSIMVYGAGANDGAAPIRTIEGVGTDLDCPAAMALDATGDLYVLNGCDGTITMYAAGADGNATPIRTIGGSNTGVDSPTGIALDAGRNVYVTNTGANTTVTSPRSITVYTAAASGNAVPMRTITGCNTNLGSPESPFSPRGIALDAAGNVYVLGRLPASSIRVYAGTASRGVTLTRTITGCNTGLDGPIGIARDRAGNLYVANTWANRVTVYAADASENAAPLRTIAGANTGLSNPQGIAVDPAGNLYVANWPAAVTVYAAGATGNVAPIRTIAGFNTRLSFPTGIAVDAAGRLYVANKGSNGNGVGITVYAPGATGPATPATVIAGSFREGPSYPQGIAVDAQGRLYIADAALTPQVLVYTPDATEEFVLTATIAGGNTGLRGFVEGIAVDATGKVYVASGTGIVVFAANAMGDAAPLATIAGAGDGLSGPTYLTF
jgi:sugar lactone lactonase YvrE